MRSNVRPLRLSLLLLLLAAAPLGAVDFFVAPDGHGDGSRRAPWGLATALSSRAVSPGDTIWLAGGVYRGTFTSELRGRPGTPIRVRAMPGARATLDGGDSRGVAVLTVGGAFTWYEGFEVTSSDPRRQSAENGSWPKDIVRGEGILTIQKPGVGIGVRFLDLAVHDTRQGFSLWADAVDAEVSGCLIWANGWDGASDRGHGHGIYTQNGVGRKRIEANAIFAQFGGGFVAYGSETAPLDNFDLEGNTIFDNGLSSRHGADRNILLGGGRLARGARLVGNVTFYRDGSANNLGYDAGCADTLLQGNAFVNLGGKALVLSRCEDGLRMEKNTFVGSVEGIGDLARYPRNVSAPGLERPRVFVRESRSGSGRVLVTVLGAEGLSSVELDVAALLRPGEAFTVRNAEDFFGPPVLEGRYAGGKLRVPLAGLRRVAPVGGGRVTRHDPALAVLVLQPASREGPPAKPENKAPEDKRRGRPGP